MAAKEKTGGGLLSRDSVGAMRTAGRRTARRIGSAGWSGLTALRGEVGRSKRETAVAGQNSKKSGVCQGPKWEERQRTRDGGDERPGYTLAWLLG